MNELLINLIVTLVTAVILPILTAVGVYVVSLIKNKIKDTKLGNALAEAENLIFESVRSTYQTYVAALKEKDEFTPEKQRLALEKTINTIYELMPKEILKVLELFYPELKVWIINKIEACIDQLKNTN
jgi:hypothetical protein